MGTRSKTYRDPTAVADLFVLAFATRNCRGGKGEKDLFYKMLLMLSDAFGAETVEPLLSVVPEYGYWKDILQLVALKPTERIATRCIELYADAIKADEAEALAKKMAKGQFDLEDLRMQLKQMQSMGGLGMLAGMLPGMKKAKAAMAASSMRSSSTMKVTSEFSPLSNRRRKSLRPRDGGDHSGGVLLYTRMSASTVRAPPLSQPLVALRTSARLMNLSKPQQGKDRGRTGEDEKRRERTRKDERLRRISGKLA